MPAECAGIHRLPPNLIRRHESILPHERMASLASELARVASDPISPQHYTEMVEENPWRTAFEFPALWPAD